MHKSEVRRSLEKQSLRLLKLLSKYPKSGTSFSRQADKYCLDLQNRIVRFDASVLDAAIAAKHVVVTQTQMKASDAGLLYLKFALHPDPSRGLSDRSLSTARTQQADGGHTVSINLAESPLSRLRFRKSRKGGAYLREEEFQAGERFRRDFERAQLQPNISANWSSEIGGSKRTNGVDPSEMSDFSLDARNRVGGAIESLGPELAGVALDICCFLKGVELVERERCWPPRSAKLMLKTALSQLARHYGIVQTNNSRSGLVRAWGAADYRPKLQPGRQP